MRKSISLIRQEVARISTQQAFLALILLQFLIAFTASFFVIGVSSLYSPGSTTGGNVVAVGVTDNSSIADTVQAESGAISSVSVRTFENNSALQTAYENQNVSAVLFEDSDGTVVVKVPQSGFAKSVVIGQVKNLLREVENSYRVAAGQPVIKHPENPVSGQFNDILFTVLVPVLLILPAYISGTIVVDSLAHKRSQELLPILRATPLSDRQLIGSIVAAAGVINIVQTILVGIGLSLNGVSASNPSLILLTLLFVGTTAISLGVFFGLLFTRRSRGQLSFVLSFAAVISLLRGIPEISPIALLTKGTTGVVTASTQVTALLLASCGIVILTVSVVWAAMMLGK